ncbi:MAG: thiamine pyrophosphate-dependent enzyme [Halobacteriales archaeon]|nr:thiamine pyrophosphate-dependent enzyme [Halobacteriales archaeon]
MHRVIGERSLEETPYGPETARGMLATMVRARRFDERALALQRRGWMSGYPPFRGQEASQIGAAAAMADDDWLVPTYRQNALLLARGVPLRDLLLFRRGFPEFNSDHEQPNFPQTVPIATQLPIATGLGMAANYRGDERAVLACFGDGATSEGDFHEALNFAGVFGAPVVFFCENNRWAISLRRDRQTASATIAGKAQAYGFEGIQVDGNDPLAVREAVERSFERARGGEPVLVESLTYRQGAHTTADEPARYRDEPTDLPEWRTADPVERFADYLLAADVIDEEFVESAREEASAAIAEAVEAAETAAEERPEAVFDSVYDELPPRLREQRAALLEREH